MDIVFNLHELTFYIDTAVVTPFSSNAGLISAASSRPGYVAKHEKKKNIDKYPRIHLVPFVLETDDLVTTHKSSSKTNTASRTTHHQPSGTPGPPSRLPLHSSICKQQLRAVTT